MLVVFAAALTAYGAFREFRHAGNDAPGGENAASFDAVGDVQAYCASAAKPESRCPEGMVYVPGSGRTPLVHKGERWSGARYGEVVEYRAVAGFCIDQYEASQPDATATSCGSRQRNDEEAPPAARSASGVMPWVALSWNEAQRACERAGKRLPTWVEWQHAFSGDLGYRYPWGDEVAESNCNYQRADRPALAPTGRCGYYVLGDGACSSGPIYDMVGNVSEWVDEFWDPECFGEDSVMIAGGGFYQTFDYENHQSSERGFLYPTIEENAGRDPAGRPCFHFTHYELSRAGVHNHPSRGKLSIADDDGFRCAKDVE